MDPARSSKARIPTSVVVRVCSATEPRKVGSTVKEIRRWAWGTLSPPDGKRLTKRRPSFITGFNAPSGFPYTAGVWRKRWPHALHTCNKCLRTANYPMLRCNAWHDTQRTAATLRPAARVALAASRHSCTETCGATVSTHVLNAAKTCASATSCNSLVANGGRESASAMVFRYPGICSISRSYAARYSNQRNLRGGCCGDIPRVTRGR